MIIVTDETSPGEFDEVPTPNEMFREWLHLWDLEQSMTDKQKIERCARQIAKAHNLNYMIRSFPERDPGLIDLGESEYTGRWEVSVEFNQVVHIHREDYSRPFSHSSDRTIAIAPYIASAALEIPQNHPKENAFWLLRRVYQQVCHVGDTREDAHSAMLAEMMGDTGYAAARYVAEKGCKVEFEMREQLRADIEQLPVILGTVANSN